MLILQNDAANIERAQTLAQENDILQRFVNDITKIGVVGDPRLLKTVYLVITSRLLKTPVSLLVKGPSSAGKSFTVEQVARFFPDAAIYSLTGMSAMAMAHDKEPLAHRMLFIHEVCGLQGDKAEYMIRSLLSSGHISYRISERQGNGQMGVTKVDREGPTGLIMTTTEIAIKEDNENRMLAVTVSDSKADTRSIMNAQALRFAGEFREETCDLQTWHTFQNLLAQQNNQVVIPYAPRVSALVESTHIRLRRDFNLFMALVQTHTLLHSASRERDAENRIIADIGDYAQVRNLVSFAMQETLEIRVSDSVRETVEAVRTLTAEQQKPTTAGAVAAYLNISRFTMSQRLKKAVAGCWIENKSHYRNATLLLPGEPMPDEKPLWPEPDALNWQSAHTSECQDRAA